MIGSQNSTDDDLDTLMAALVAWESKDAAGEMFGDIFGLVVSRGDPKLQAHLEAERLTEKQQCARAKAVRQEQSVVLRAKLLTLRDRRRVERIVARNVEG